MERRVEAPLVDLRLLKNRVLIGATVGILLSAGVINGLMYLVGLYFQNPATLALSAWQAGLATLPATVGLIAATPLVPRMVQRVGTGAAIGPGFAAATAGCALLVFVQGGWTYSAFVLPLVLMAAGLGLVNGPASSASTSTVSADDVGAASGAGLLLSVLVVSARRRRPAPGAYGAAEASHAHTVPVGDR